MKIDIKEIANGSKWVGKKVWICDYRQPDIDKKPIRHQKPACVIVVSNSDLPKNKRIYYSENHFRNITSKGEMGSQVISLFDNTGYRALTGTPLDVFETEEECKEAYRKKADVIIDALEVEMSMALKRLENQKNEVISNKNNFI